MSLSRHPSGPAVLVVGAGLAGMTAAHHLAEWGAQVTLADRAPHLGGAFLLLDHTFTTDACGLCLALPRQPSYCPTIACDLDARILPLTHTTLADLAGEAGDFVATLHHAPRYVDPELCDHCGACAEVCPALRGRSALARVGSRSGEEIKAIYPPAPRAVPYSYAIDPDACTRCGACVDACPRGAIDLAAAGGESRIEVHAVLLSPGFAPFDAAQAVEYGWGRYANVVTSLEYERLLNRSGPTGGRLVRPSDAGAVRRIAFLHCVGSRSERLGRPHCSTSCCMVTAKQVALTTEVVPQVEVTAYTMDVRAVGKGYERYVQRVRSLPGVTYRWGLPAAVHETPAGDLRLLTPEGEQVYDLVVLGVGTGAPDGVRQLAAAARVALDAHGAVLAGDDGPGSTSRPGVYAAGSALAPADVPEVVTQAACAAALAARSLRMTPTASARPVPGKREAQEGRLDAPPRVGVFLCTCRGALDEETDLCAPASAAGRLRGVAHLEVVEDACEEAGQAAIERAAIEHDLNRIVIAGCSPRLYADRFNALMERLGLPRRLLFRIDARTGPAGSVGDELAMAVAGLRETPFQPLNVRAQEDTAQCVLVLGGGLAGMAAALTLADLGVPCDLVERTAQLGGNLRESVRTLEGIDARALLSETVARVRQAPGVRVWTEAELVDWSGVRGEFVGTVRSAAGAGTVSSGDSGGDSAPALRAGASVVPNTPRNDVWREQYGALILATGGQQTEPRGFLYGQHPGVVTQRELASLIADCAPAVGGLRSVAMIQCVGSRDEVHPYCSRVCCAQAIGNALALKALDPGIEVSVLFRDMCTTGTQELYYLQARREGVMFLRHDEEHSPRVTTAGGPGAQLQVTAWDAGLDVEVALHPDLLVLSAGIEPADGAEDLARLIGAPLDEDGFYAEAHPKLRPTDLTQPGIHLCGLAYGPRTIEETVGQARAAALRAALAVARPQEPRRDIATVVRKLCSYCGLCVTHCPYGARVLDPEERYAHVVEHLCQGCGVCVAVCPNGATRQPALEPVQLMAMVDAAIGGQD